MLPCSARPARVIAPEHPRLARPTIAACPQPSALGRPTPHGPSPPALAAGVAADLLLADPRRGHPVAGFGAVAAAAERAVHRDSRLAGTAYAVVLTGAAAALGRAVERSLPGSLPTAGATALATWAVVGGTSLRREAHEMSRLLEAGDLDAARQRLSHLCGRDPAGLDEAGLARATVESVAENTSDAVVGPLVWGAIGGVPGLLAYRAVNTLDAMVGHRSPRYERFGWAAARADDVANLLPSRVSAYLASGFAPVVGGRARSAVRGLAARRPQAPEPQRRPGRGGVRRRAVPHPRRAAVVRRRVEDRPLLGDGPGARRARHRPRRTAVRCGDRGRAGSRWHAAGARPGPALTAAGPTDPPRRPRTTSP
jgi:adenosylcobinamide-phosphate synthase